MAISTFNAIFLAGLCLAVSGFPEPQRSCKDGGREYQENQKWDDGKSVFQCKRDGDYLNAQAVGCIGDGYRKMELGEKAQVGDFVYECRLDRNSVPALAPWGCADKNGQKHAIGDQFDMGDFWYSCMERDGKISADRIGCIHEGKRLTDGDRFFQDDVINECYVTKNDAGIRAAGCVTQNVQNGAKIERRVGCSWVEGTAPFQYTLTCKPDAAMKSVTKTAVKCNYAMSGGTYDIELGCYRAIDKTGVVCMQGASAGEVKFFSLSLDEAGNVRSPPPGSRQC